MSYFLWLLGGLAIAVAGLAVRGRFRRAGLALVIAGFTACAAAIGWQVRTFIFSSAPPAIDRYSATAAYFMGQEVLDELRSFEGSVYLLLPPDRRGNQRQLDSLFNTFARVLSPMTGLQVKDVVVRTSDREIREGRVTLAAFEQALAAATGAVACVSFIGVPAGFEKLPPMPVTRAPLFFVYDPTGGTVWRTALKKGLVRRVIAARPDAPKDGGGALTGPPDELFRRFFVLARPGNADAVARQLGGTP